MEHNLYDLWFTVVRGQNGGQNNGQDVAVTIITNPPGIPIEGQPTTFDYLILSNVTLTCNVTADGSPIIVTSYLWNTTECYTCRGGGEDPCFYNNTFTGKNITGNDLLAQDAVTVICTAIIGGINYTSSPLTLRISGE